MDQKNGGPFRLGLFGLGQVGLRVARLADGSGWKVFGFSRNSGFGAGVPVDLTDKGSLQELPREPVFDLAVVTVPPENLTPDFWTYLLESSRQRILLGTTGIYQRQSEGRGEITEETPLRPDHPRIDLESQFLGGGGKILRLAGLYGGSRNPLNWVRQNRVGYESRQVNLIHVGDVAKAILAVAGKSDSKVLYNLADGQSHTWREIIDQAVTRGWLEHSRRETAPRKADGFVDNSLFLNDFPEFRFRDFWTALQRLQEGLSV